MKTNLDILKEGLEEIARNHGLYADTKMRNGDNPCIYGGNSVPTLADVQFLCEDVGIERGCIDSSEYGIYIYADQWLWDGTAMKEYKGGAEFWRRAV